MSCYVVCSRRSSWPPIFFCMFFLQCSRCVLPTCEPWWSEEEPYLFHLMLTRITGYVDPMFSRHACLTWKLLARHRSDAFFVAAFVSWCSCVWSQARCGRKFQLNCLFCVTSRLKTKNDHLPLPKTNNMQIGKLLKKKKKKNLQRLIMHNAAQTSLLKQHICFVVSVSDMFKK